MNSSSKFWPLIVLGCAALLAGCERPPIESVQRGFRGLGMVEFYNPRIVNPKVPAHAAPEIVPAAEAGSPPVTSVYKNVKVLTDVSVGEFTRLMLAMTNWVSPKDGCNYCHEVGNFESDKLYTKVVARRMLQMTRHINSDWTTHVAATGVTCYTCHRGQPVPGNLWFATQDQTPNYLGNKDGQNVPTMTVALASLPADPFTAYLAKKGEVRVAGAAALPSGHGATIRDTEATYGLMMNLSQSLGVNCTYCHNSRSFGDWSGSTPQRTTAWHGIRMMRDLNVEYLAPLGGTLPRTRLGAMGDAPKANCATCHQGVFKPLYGAGMLKDYPALGGGKVSGVAAAETVPVAVESPPVSVSAAPEAPSVAAGPLARILFDTGKTKISSDGLKAIEEVARQIRANADQTVGISGFADKTGNPDSNLELAKKRAVAVRDALAAAGIPEGRIKLKKPEFAIGGAVADSRRVDIVAQ